MALMVLLTVSATSAWADPIQITLSSSTTGSAVFTNNGGTLSFSFSGISGNVLLEPQTMLGTYWISMTGSPILTGGPSDYTVNMNGAAIYLTVKLTGYSDTLTTNLYLTDLHAGMSGTPLFDGTFGNLTNTVGAQALSLDFPNGTVGLVDFTVRLKNGQTLGTLGNHQSASGSISSGELYPAPEPSSLALLGTGILGLAGVIRRKMK